MLMVRNMSIEPHYRMSAVIALKYYIFSCRLGNVMNISSLSQRKSQRKSEAVLYLHSVVLDQRNNYCTIDCPSKRFHSRLKIPNKTSSSFLCVGGFKIF